MSTLNPLPHESGKLFLTDGGLETSLIFHEGLDLPYFAACDLVFSEEGAQHLRAYYRSYALLAKEKQTGFILESATWRANPDWTEKLGYDEAAFEAANSNAIAICQEIRNDYQDAHCPMLVSGCIGPRGDGYQANERMTVSQARDYHLKQIRVLKNAGVDMITALTMTNSEEAIGVVEAAREVDLPVVISFTVETDGKLPSGEGLKEAIERVDGRTNDYPAYYMINCAHPDHFAHVLSDEDSWKKRLGGLRANASCKSHAELDESTELDDGNPKELGLDYQKLMASLPALKVLGGCCGTDHRHIEEMYKSCSGHIH